MTAALVAVTLFGVLLAAAVDRALYADERGELERLALRGAGAVSPDFRSDPVELPESESSVALGVYGLDGQRVAGTGPASLEPALVIAARRDVSEAASPEEIVVAVPARSGERVVAIVRAADPLSDVQHRVWLAWGGLAGLGLAALGVAAAVAAAQSKRLSQPLVRLAAMSETIGDGDARLASEPTHVAEIDQLATALDTTSTRVSELIRRERTLAAYASHQLRTPLTALRLELESALGRSPDQLPAAVEGALTTADQLAVTIDDMLAAVRDAPLGADDGRGVKVSDLLDDVRARWHGILAARGRRLVITDDTLVGTPPRIESSGDLEAPAASSAPAGAARHIVDVLVDNALRHGTGEVEVLARVSGEAIAIDVIDEGTAELRLPPRPPLDATPSKRVEDDSARAGGLGLTLARDLAETLGGRIVLGPAEEQTRVSVLLPRRPRGGAHDGIDSGRPQG